MKIIALLLALLLVPALAFGLALDPAKLELTGSEKSGIYYGEIHLVSEENVPLMIEVKVVDFTFDGEKITWNEPHEWSAVTWIKVKPDKMILKSHQKATIKFRIAVPEGTVPGKYRAFIEATALPKTEGGGIKVGYSMGTCVYVTIRGR